MLLFGDEGGNPGDFTDRADDRHFLVVTVSVADFSWFDQLEAVAQRLRERFGIAAIGRPFHAHKDRPEVKREVLTLLSQQIMRIDATIVDKRRLGPLWKERRRLYAAIWAAHLVHPLPQLHPQSEPVEVVIASIGTKSEMRAFRRGADRAVAQASAEAATYPAVLGLGVLGRMQLGTPAMVVTSRTANAGAEPGLQVADYCTWAIRRRWERPSEPAWAHELLADKMATERLIDLPRGP
jgi:hypothetical protein